MVTGILNLVSKPDIKCVLSDWCSWHRCQQTTGSLPGGSFLGYIQEQLLNVFVPTTVLATIDRTAW